MSALRFMQCLAWGMLAISVVSALFGGCMATGIHGVLCSTATRFAHYMGGAQ